VIGQLGGGLLIQIASWRWVFAINAVPVVITLGLLRTLPSDRRSPGHVDVLGAVLAALGLAGPVFALIEQPHFGWGSPNVLIPLLAGLALLAAFVVVEQRERDPMLPFVLFRSRNFTVGNLTTLTLYAGLNVATFFLVLFVQQVGGYSALQAGLSLLPITVLVFLLAKRFGALADRIGPHAFMAGGPLVAAAGLVLLLRVNADADYVTQVLPGIAVFGLGLAATVAPLTAAVLGSVEQGHSGVASGVNNMVARVAGLLAIAALGAVVAGSFHSRLSHDVRGQRLGAATAAVVSRSATRPLVVSTNGVPPQHRAAVEHAMVDASVHAFRLALLIAAALAAFGALIALIGIENPRRKVECADCPGGALAGASVDVARSEPARLPAAGEPARA
jgi:predicted MFS family arabinose efflux permease